jgi:hypothetical protein
MDYNYYTQEELNSKLVSAAYDNDLSLIKELLTSPKLKIKAQINADSRFIGNICSNGDLNTLKYVLTSPELKEHANIHLDSERALACAIYEADIPMVKYLLFSPEIKEHGDLYYKNNGEYTNIEYIFKVRAFDKSAILIDYFTLEYAIEKKDAKIYKELFEYSDDSDLRKQIIDNWISNIVKEKNQIHQHELKVLLKNICQHADEDYIRENIAEILVNNIVKPENQVIQHELIVLLKHLDPDNKLIKAYELSQELNGELHTNEQTKSKKIKP